MKLFIRILKKKYLDVFLTQELLKLKKIKLFLLFQIFLIILFTLVEIALKIGVTILLSIKL